MEAMIILPAYNVKNKLSVLLNGLNNYKNRVLFVDDGSTDGTRKIIQDAGFDLIYNSVMTNQN